MWGWCWHHSWHPRRVLSWSICEPWCRGWYFIWSECVPRGWCWYHAWHPCWVQPWGVSAAWCGCWNHVWCICVAWCRGWYHTRDPWFRGRWGLAVWHFAARISWVCNQSAVFGHIILVTSVSTPIHASHLVFTDTLEITAIIPLLSLLEQHTIVHAPCSFRCRGRSPCGSRSGDHTGRTVGLLTAGVVGVRYQTTACWQVIKLGTNFGASVVSSHLVKTFTVVFTAVLPFLALMVHVALVDTHMGWGSCGGSKRWAVAWGWGHGWLRCGCGRPAVNHTRRCSGRGQIARRLVLSVLEDTLGLLTAERITSTLHKGTLWGQLPIMGTSLITGVYSIHGIFTGTGVVTAIIPLLTLGVVPALVHTHIGWLCWWVGCGSRGVCWGGRRLSTLRDLAARVGRVTCQSTVGRKLYILCTFF